jgi:hypothetical protein
VTAATISRSAALSEDGVYRYDLSRTWEIGKPCVVWIMLNPSTADHLVEDATIRKCMAFAKAWGYGGIVVRNLFAYRATDPKVLAKLDRETAIGPDNNRYLAGLSYFRPQNITVCAWGAHGDLHTRAGEVLKILAQRGPVYHLGMTKGGHPRHPLYLPGITTPSNWRL